MPNLEFATVAIALPAWTVAAAAALFLCIGVLTLTRAGASMPGALLRVGTVVAAFTAAGFWLTHDSLREHAAERRALDQRISDLDARAIAPGSALACLDAGAGDAVETACEKAVFATPQSVAQAVTYVSARLALLADATEFARRTGGNYDGGLATLRLAIEADRYGIVAHVLSVRNSCTPLLCDSYALLRDPDRVQANLRERLFDRYLERYAPEWARAQAATTPSADVTSSTSTAAGASPPAPGAASPTGAPVASRYEFPSAASIPPVSIMSSEPSMPPETKAESKTEANPGTAAHRPPQRGAPARSSARAGTPTQQPQPIGPPPSTAAAPAAR